MAYAAYIVMAIGVGRAKRTQFNWAITGAAAAVNVTLNLILIPAYGIMGAAVATVGAYVVMFLGMTWYAQRVFPCRTSGGACSPPSRRRSALPAPRPPARGLHRRTRLSLAYPLALLLLGFFLPRSGRSLLGRGSAASRRSDR
jgi:hypothetical protein